jgi:hypothetical protein
MKISIKINGQPSKENPRANNCSLDLLLTQLKNLLVARKKKEKKEKSRREIRVWRCRQRCSNP